MTENQGESSDEGLFGFTVLRVKGIDVSCLHQGIQPPLREKQLDEALCSSATKSCAYVLKEKRPFLNTDSQSRRVRSNFASESCQHHKLKIKTKQSNSRLVSLLYKF